MKRFWSLLVRLSGRVVGRLSKKSVSTMEEERLVASPRRSRQYGACARRPDTAAQGPLVRHDVAPGDTLQGLALKYRTTTEKIRRANRLFATDSLFLREYLMIPVSQDFVGTHSECVTKKPDNISHRASIAAIPNSSDEFSPDSPEKKMFDEFLNKVDTSLASIKKDVEKTSEKSEFGKYSAELYTKKRPTPRLRQSSSIGGVSSSSNINVIDNENSYHGVMGESVVLAEGRHVRSSLQRLQRTQDDWFQL